MNYLFNQTSVFCYQSIKVIHTYMYTWFLKLYSLPVTPQRTSGQPTKQVFQLATVCSNDHHSWQTEAVTPEVLCHATSRLKILPCVQMFNGIWRMQDSSSESTSSIQSYHLLVRSLSVTACNWRCFDLYIVWYWLYLSCRTQSPVTV